MRIFIIFLFVIFNFNNTFGQDQIHKNEILKYIFMGHTYQRDGGGSKVDERIEQLDFSEYEGIWLGGDICSEATLDYSTIEYLDSLFDLSNENTYWTFGNHDIRNGNLEWIYEFSGKGTYYSHYQNGFTSIILNTNLIPSQCEQLNDQYYMIENVCDTIQQSSHLILIMHHGIWRDVPDLPPPATYAHSDLIYWNSNCFSVNSTFVNSIYPMLLEVKNRGVEVICILGDMGASQKKFDMQSIDGISFLGCGLNSSPEDYVLILEYETESQDLIYKFHNLDSLSNKSTSFYQTGEQDLELRY
jgi:hypothetical protein